MMDRKQLEMLHPAYERLAGEWEYAWRSYSGGMAYRSGEYLREYANEREWPGNHYEKRLFNTPLPNHVKSITHLYRGFLFRRDPSRPIEDIPGAADFASDTDLMGTNLTDAMKAVTRDLILYGMSWLVMDRPARMAASRGEELEMGLRTYMNRYDPSCVLDWRMERDPAGRPVLTMLKIVEDRSTIVAWTPDMVERHTVEMDFIQARDNNNLNRERAAGRMLTIKRVVKSEEMPNPLGKIPAICVANDPDPDGVGMAMASDWADAQRMIYNFMSELEQAIRLSTHPTTVLPRGVNAEGGAGAVLRMEEGGEEGKPFLLQPSGASADAILASIAMLEGTIEKLAHVSGIRGSKGSAMSGVALQAERQLLNAVLQGLVVIIQEAEEKVWRCWAEWSGVQLPDDFAVVYPKSFDLRDRETDVKLLAAAEQLAVVPEIRKGLQARPAQLVFDDEETTAIAVEAVEALPAEQFASELMTMPMDDENA